MATYSKGEGGFLDFVSGTFETDTRSVGSWDQPMASWVPARLQDISPSGDAYAYVRYTGTSATLAVQTLHPAKSKDLLFKPSGSLEVVGYTAEGIYVQRFARLENGLWFVDPSVASAKLIEAEPNDQLNETYWDFIGDAVAWGKGKSSDPAQGEVLMALNLSTGRKTEYFFPNSSGWDILGLSSGGAPIVSTYVGNESKIVEILGQSAALEIGANQGRLWWANSDRFGTWFSGGDESVWLYNGHDLRRLAIAHRDGTRGSVGAGAIPAPGPLHVAGPCL
jgi:hypothetical protein